MSSGEGRKGGKRGLGFVRGKAPRRKGGGGFWLSGSSSFLFLRHIEWNWGQPRQWSGRGPADVELGSIRLEFGSVCVRIIAMHVLFILHIIGARIDSFSI